MARHNALKADIDGLDLNILAELVENSKMTFKELSRKLSIHPNVVAYRVKRLEQAGIIRDYTVQIDLEKLGLSEHVYVSATFPTFNERDRILEEISQIPQVVRVMSLLGIPGLILFIVGKSKAEVDVVISKLRNLNMKIENAAPVVRIYRDHIPGDFFKDLH